METLKDHKIEEVALSIINVSRNTLILHLRFMDSAISRLRWLPLSKIRSKRPGFASISGEELLTDGTAIVYDANTICRLYLREAEAVPRAYLHMMLHCVFRHFAVGPTIQRNLWNLACDMAVEGIINELHIPSLDVKNSEKQKDELSKVAPAVHYLLTADKIYYWLKKFCPSNDELMRMTSLFRFDSHELWYSKDLQANLQAFQQLENQQQLDQSDLSNSSAQRDKTEQNQTQKDLKPDNEQNNQQENGSSESQLSSLDSSDSISDKSNNVQSNSALASDSEKKIPSSNVLSGSFNSARIDLEKAWADISERIQLDMESFSKGRGNVSGGLIQNLQEVNREKYDYSSFLKKFSTIGEIMKVNDDEFDYIFYTYGMKLFPEMRMPLIEPLEYKDVKRIREFVIAIDTSASVMGQEVQSFLQKTYNILKSTETFFSKINVHIIQCDSQIQEHRKITSQDEFDNYISSVKILGLGGTDFCPVFEFVDKLIAQKEFNNLKGLVYFTDGYGRFPAQMPKYKAAFVFVRDDYSTPAIPAWAIKIIIQRNELQGWKEIKS